jgi:hypothetical protein
MLSQMQSLKKISKFKISGDIMTPGSTKERGSISNP